MKHTGYWIFLNRTTVDRDCPRLGSHGRITSTVKPGWHVERLEFGRGHPLHHGHAAMAVVGVATVVPPRAVDLSVVSVEASAARACT
jgi:hypothetical protein